MSQKHKGEKTRIKWGLDQKTLHVILYLVLTNLVFCMEYKQFVRHYVPIKLVLVWKDEKKFILIKKFPLFKKMFQFVCKILKYLRWRERNLELKYFWENKAFVLKVLSYIKKRDSPLKIKPKTPLFVYLFYVCLNFTLFLIEKSHFFSIFVFSNQFGWNCVYFVVFFSVESP